ncbi:glycoside hydrolase family 16 protein [Mycena filopes]|nr:glycoside hydrolase family 16 protein [Mycena filopes]
MLRLTLVFLSIVPLFSEASSGASRMRLRRAAPNTTTTWVLQKSYKGEQFLTEWDFWDQSDPTNGAVNYLNVSAAKSANLAFVREGNMILAVDNTTTLQDGNQKCNSVRISSKATYGVNSLFIADFGAMPASCGAWPAWWTVGPSWPQGGEIDVLEGVYKTGTNKMTLHTSADCTVDFSHSMTGRHDKTGNSDSVSCVSENGSNQGCGVSDPDSHSYGSGFNAVGGGVYAHSWTNDAISIWHFPRGSIPEDIRNGQPNPSNWPTPTGYFAAGSGCDFSKHFYEHVLTIDTTLCGDWAGSVNPSDECPLSCEELVKKPSYFDDARWNITSIQVYTTGS